MSGADRTNQGGFTRAAKDCFSGTVGGIVQVFVGQPFDTVKVRLQTQETKPGEPPKYTSMLDCVRKTRKEGLTAFYKGTTTPLVGVGACVSIQFLQPLLFFVQLNIFVRVSKFKLLLLEYFHLMKKLRLKSIMDQSIASKKSIPAMRAMLKEKKSRNELPGWKKCLYGAAAGYGMWCSIYPIDVIKSKIQTDSFSKEKRKYSSSFDCARQILAKEGIKGFFKGFGTCMLRAGPVNASSFVAFEFAMELFEKI
ncbi:mitochondrial carrier [Rhizophagus clarus]|uniref:Mitochondrial carrier n=1 Tax=Rhizophagus clarus TaxID=94130 RepID=A0A8H3L2I9_9GLOM|nr:mitochondrial carrier [Rhizophagus clarus]